MSSRYMSLIPDFAHQAFEAWYAYSANDEKLEEFAGKWGGFSYEHFIFALEYGQRDDRLCAMFAIGASPHSEAAGVLLPFLRSAHREERWVSALVLGKRHDSRVFSFLEPLLLDGLSLDEYTQAFVKGDLELRQELFLCERFRPKVVELLEAWDSSTLIATMTRALGALWDLEKRPERFPIEERSYDTLCYALGQRGMLSILDTLDFPPVYRKVSTIYLALGALHMRPDPTLMRSVLRERTALERFLHETFHIEEKDVEDYIEAFYREDEVRSAYRATMDERAVGENLTQHLVADSKDPEFFADTGEEEEEQEEESIVQKEINRICVYRKHTAAIWSVAWSPDGTSIASGSADTTAQVWNAQTGKQICSFEGHRACVTAVAWSPDGEWVASGGCDNRVVVWNAQTGEILTIYTAHRAWICQGLAWSPDGVYLASASWDGGVHIWEAKTGKMRLRYQGHQGVVTSVAWSADGMQVVSGGGYPECAIHVWNAASGQLQFIYKAHMQDTESRRSLSPEILKSDEAWARGPSSVRAVAWSPDGRWIASSGLRNVFRIWSAQTGEDLIAEAPNHLNGSLVWSDDSQFLATENYRNVDIWNIVHKKIMLRYVSVQRSMVTTLAWSPDRKYLVASGERPDICVWRAEGF